MDIGETGYCPADGMQQECDVISKTPKDCDRMSLQSSEYVGKVHYDIAEDQLHIPSPKQLMDQAKGRQMILTCYEFKIKTRII